MNKVHAGTPESPEALSAEYSALRDEILKRMELRQALEIYVSAGVSALYGAVLAYKLSPLVPMTYPVLALFLALSWSHHYYRSGQIGDYIRWYLETLEHGGPGYLCNGRWQHFLKCYHHRYGWREASLTTIGAGGVFIFTELLAIGLGLYRWRVCSIVGQHLFWTRLLLVVDILALAGTLVAVRRRQRADSRVGEPPNWSELPHFTNPEKKRHGKDAGRRST